MRQSDNSEAGILLRPMQPRDVTFLTSLWVASWRETMPAIDFAGRADWIDGFLRAPGRTTLVAEGVLEGPGAPLGFATWETIPGSSTILHQLVVAPPAKGTGVAARLLDAAKAASPDGLSLEVNQANARALRFYTREGFACAAAGRNPISGLETWHMTWTAPVQVRTDVSQPQL